MLLEEQGIDGRLFERFQARFPARFKDTRSDFGDNVRLRDASAQGAKLTTKDRLYLHDSVSVEVKLPDGQDPLVMRGKVVWSKNNDPDNWDIGIRFHKVSLMNMSRLFKFV
ncbi:MAG: PilZ domain-containing protein [Candidatus Zapsychrus exili]|nr:PilZ domain-containing protein [Candidatus Zapsychrus exili]